MDISLDMVNFFDGRFHPICDDTMSNTMVKVQLFFKDRSCFMDIPVKYCYPKFLVFLADITVDCIFVLCPFKYGCRQFCNTLDRR